MLTTKAKVVAKTQIQAQRQPRQILRTIVLPNEQINTLQVEVDNLRKINEEQKALYEQEIVGLKEDRRAREEEMRLKYVDCMIINDLYNANSARKARGNAKESSED